MPKSKTPLARAAGKLISAVQKVSFAQIGEPNAEFSMNVLDAAHQLAQAEGASAVVGVLEGRSVSRYLGELWVRRFPSVFPAIRAFEEALQDELQDLRVEDVGPNRR